MLTLFSEGDWITVVNIGADADAIRTSYKRLAQKWHPEKNPRSEEAVLVGITVSVSMMARSRIDNFISLSALSHVCGPLSCTLSTRPHSCHHLWHLHHCHPTYEILILWAVQTAVLALTISIFAIVSSKTISPLPIPLFRYLQVIPSIPILISFEPY